MVKRHWSKRHWSKRHWSKRHWSKRHWLLVIGHWSLVKRYSSFKKN